MFYQNAFYFKHVLKYWLFSWENTALESCDNVQMSEKWIFITFLSSCLSPELGVFLVCFHTQIFFIFYYFFIFNFLGEVIILVFFSFVYDTAESHC